MWGQVSDGVKQQLQTPPLIPPEFSVTSEIFGKLQVTEHAWGQFCHRYLRVTNQLDQPGKYATKFFARHFRRCFSRARETFLPVHKKTLRIISHSFRQARYFSDPHTRLRFVVEEGKTAREMPRIVTVEIPFY